MIQVIIISDTHLSTIENIPNFLLNKIKNSDIVIHCGDFDSNYFYEELKSFSKKLYGVVGNCDIGIHLPKKLLINIDGLKIGICHGAGSKANIINRLNYIFVEDIPHIICYGHTHIPFNQNINNIIFFNPGSSSYNRTVNYKSYGEMLIDKGMIIKLNIEKFS